MARSTATIKKRARSSSSSSSSSRSRHKKKRARSSSSQDNGSADVGLGEGKPYHGKYFHGASLPPNVTSLIQLPMLAVMEALHIIDSIQCPKHLWGLG